MDLISFRFSPPSPLPERPLPHLGTSSALSFTSYTLSHSLDEVVSIVFFFFFFERRLITVPLGSPSHECSGPSIQSFLTKLSTDFFQELARGSFHYCQSLLHPNHLAQESGASVYASLVAIHRFLRVLGKPSIAPLDEPQAHANSVCPPSSVRFHSLFSLFFSFSLSLFRI